MLLLFLSCVVAEDLSIYSQAGCSCLGLGLHLRYVTGIQVRIQGDT